LYFLMHISDDVVQLQETGQSFFLLLICVLFSSLILGFIELMIFQLEDLALVLHPSLFAAAMDKNLW